MFCTSMIYLFSQKQPTMIFVPLRCFFLIFVNYLGKRLTIPNRQLFSIDMSEVQRDAIRLELNINNAPCKAMGTKLAERIPHFGDSCPLCQEQSEMRIICSFIVH
uniref:Uncharacterized protein n=1 Tax=Ananas comosus var. bracteatus TaxID=296719 RepID=A0A6V7NX01_ANACO|nr:unnamed protein product [Ananas comosus var. bracteatus]